jgi:hypothetical protein
VIHLVQHLCPKRHCIMAVAFNSDDSNEGEAIESLKEGERSLGVYPFCGICGSTDLTFECRATPFKTMEEARPVLAIVQRANIDAARFFAQQPKDN